MGIEKQNETSFFEQTGSMNHAASHAAKLNAIFIPTILFFSSVASAIVLSKGGYMVESQLIELAFSCTKAENMLY